MESSSSQQQEIQSSPPPVLVIPDIPAEVVDPAPDELQEAIFIEDPIDSVQSNISENLLGRICTRHNISLDDALLPGPSDRPHCPPEGYTAFYRHACAAGTLPPFNQYIREMLSFLGIAPSQLHPNGHALLNSSLLYLWNTFSALQGRWKLDIYLTSRAEAIVRLLHFWRQ